MNRKLKNEELDRLSIDEFKSVDKAPIRVILDNVRSLANVGSVFRTCDAFLIDTLYLCGITGCPPHRDINKTALGATESVNWIFNEDILEVIEECKKDGYTVYSVEQSENSIQLDEMPRSKKVALIFGNEVNGVGQESINKSDGVLEIPQYGTKHSLNISVAAGVAVWETRKRTSQ